MKQGKQKMGSKKRGMELIEDPTNRMVTYAKRRIGLLKKAYELSVLCETDMALLITSPSGKLTCFAASGQSRIEDVFTKFIDLADGERGFPLEDKQQLYRLLEKLKLEDSCARIECGTYNSKFVQNNVQKILQLQDEIEKSQEQLRLYYPEPTDLTTMEEVEKSEGNLLEAMDRVSERMHYLSSRSRSSNNQQLVKNQIQEQALSSTSKLQDIQYICCQTNVDNYGIMDNNQRTSEVSENKFIPSQLLSYEQVFHKNGQSITDNHYAQCPPFEPQIDDAMFMKYKIPLSSSTSNVVVSSNEKVYEGSKETLKRKRQKN